MHQLQKDGGNPDCRNTLGRSMQDPSLLEPSLLDPSVPAVNPHDPSLRASHAVRTFAVALLAVAVLGSAGCGWFRHKSDAYKLSSENRPLEVPPDLNLPDTQSAMQLPGEKSQSVTRSSLTPVAGADAPGFAVAGDRDSVYTKVGDALAAINGVTIASKAQLLGAYDVSYEGASFLVRVSAAESGVYVSAVDARGQPATAAAPAKLIKALQAALGG